MGVEQEKFDAAQPFVALMKPPGKSFSVDASQLVTEGGTDPAFGTVMWRTLICADRTPSAGMVLGVAEFGPYGTLLPHRHAPAEFYLGLTGNGTVTVDGVAHLIAPGVAIYLDGDAEHGVVAGPEGLSFAYGFPTNRFADVAYRFSASND
ncbi:cupin domain-containing protein [Actibacterium lipolyticum]|uniref:Cupin domain protein n=1 Tax=Actibacterium lipolyticum TaxID=1524263 RepID=A0A238KMU8_9RHOB|nr:cupin domain-containing protein [Actibacterium lipolyticum]SMX44113.1 Cupin domain protein [Actibacterium lipolyticum]